MKLRFFGDSWYWSWYYGVFKSKSLNKKLLNNAGFPALEAYFKYLGYESICYNSPGNSFVDTVNEVLATTEHTDIKYNIVFFSSHMRGFTYLNPDVTNYETFIRQYNTITIKNLSNLNMWAKENNQEVLLLGGQGTLHKKVFDCVLDNKKIHLVSECIMSDLLSRNKPFGIFKLATDITNLVDNTWHYDLVQHMHKDITEWENNKDKVLFTHPDSGHLNGNGSLLLSDMIMKKIEELEEGEKI